MNEHLYAEAIRKLECYIKSGIRGFAQQAFDRLRECGMTERSLSRMDEWDTDFAAELHNYLVTE